MAIMMPASDTAVLARRDAIVAALRAIVPGEGVIDSAAEMTPYESDGLMAYRQPPMVVVLPDSAEQVSRILKYCFEEGIKVVPRGAGTSLSGEIIKVGGKAAETGGYDLMGIITGSEGLLVVITEVTVRSLQKPETARALMVGFAEVEAAGQCVA